MNDELAALTEAHRRLRLAAQQVIDEAQAVGTPQRPMAGIPAHVLRGLRRELAHEPHPHGLKWMSVS